MSMVVASALPMRTRRPRVLSGLFTDTARVYTTDACRIDPASCDEYDTITVGKPLYLGTLYARYPLLTLFGLLGLGWAGGYFTWLWLGRRKR